MNIAELKQIIRYNLGEPFHTLNISDDQMNILIGRALDKYREQHNESTEKDILLLSVQDGVRKYTLDPSIFSVISYYETDFTAVPLSLRYTKMGIIDSSTIVDIISYSVLEMYSKTVNRAIEAKSSFTYNPRTNQLIFENTPQVSETWGLEVLITISEDDSYEDDWLQEYATALCKYQYGWNLAKMERNLPGATRINYTLMMDEAKLEIEKLEEELKNEHIAPIPIFIG